METGHTPPLDIPAGPLGDPQTAVSETELAAAFTEWDRRYREEPERFMSEACDLLRETPETYGQACAPYLLAIIEELRHTSPKVLTGIRHFCGAAPLPGRMPPDPAAAPIPSTTRPALNEGETYLGTIVSACGTLSHHTILLPGDHDDANWQDAMDWAKSIGGDLPNRIEQALLFATLKDQFKLDLYWSNTLHASDASCAWFQTFYDGFQGFTHVTCQCRARAVRRLPIQPFSNLA